MNAKKHYEATKKLENVMKMEKRLREQYEELK